MSVFVLGVVLVYLFCCGFIKVSVAGPFVAYLTIEDGTLKDQWRVTQSREQGRKGSAGLDEVLQID